ncbi:MAG: T9SS type A sorting domain-containing protein [Bacteroidetes bacterium]|nr:T9SS type A sorting domain-containing protein [Bacteroidota bacterium]
MKYLALVLLLIAANASAQVPRIDSMVVDETTEQLHVFGKFGSEVGTVWVDSVGISLLAWSDSVLVCTIPRSGRGMAGPVEVEVRGFRSMPSLLSLWSCSNSFFGQHELGQGKMISEDFLCLFRARFDIQSRLLAGRLSTSVIQSVPFAHETYNYSDASSGNVINTADSGLVNITFDLAQNTVTFNHWASPNVHLDYHSDFHSTRLDSSLNIVSSLVIGSGPNSSGYAQINSIASFLPSSAVSALRFRPNPRYPTSDSLLMVTGPVDFRWDSMWSITSYHIQIATDSSFASVMFDDTSVTPVTTFTFPIHVPVVYWRVAGLNSEGQSRWSQTWRIRMEDQGTVLIGDRPNASFTCTPNPASNALHLTLPAPARVVLYDLRGNVVRSIATSEPSVTIETRDLASGMYIVGVTTSGMHGSQLVQIQH